MIAAPLIELSSRLLCRNELSSSESSSLIISFRLVQVSPRSVHFTQPNFSAKVARRTCFREQYYTGTRSGAKHSPPGAKVSKVRSPPVHSPGDPLSQAIMCQMKVKFTIGICDHNIFDVLSDGNNPVAQFRAQPCPQATTFGQCRKNIEKSMIQNSI